MGGKPVCAAKLTGSRHAKNAMSGSSRKPSPRERSTTRSCPLIFPAGKIACGITMHASSSVGRSTSAETANWRTLPRLLILLALLSDCRLICGENLTTLKTEGRGKGVRGRFRNWRNNTTVRGDLWRALKYKCHLLGMRARQVEPRGTTHTCPRCGQAAKTYLSPASPDREGIELGSLAVL